MAEIPYLCSIDMNDNQIKNLKLHVLSGSEPTGAAGMIFYDGDDNLLKFHNGTDFLSPVVASSGAVTSVTSLLATDIKIGEDDQTKIDFETADTINFYAANAKEMVLVANALTPGTSDGTALGTGSLMWSDLFLASGGVVNFNNGDVTLTHSSNTLTVAGGTLATAALTASTGTFSGILKTDDTTDATSTTDGSLQTDGGLSVAKDAVIGDDLILLSDAAQIAFGANKEILLKHDHNSGLILQHSATADGAGTVFTISSAEAALTANEEIGAIAFDPSDSDGTDGTAVSARIAAVAEGTFAADNNATRLEFQLGQSEAASTDTARMTLSSAGLLTITDDLVIKDGGTIGVSSANDAMTISSGGIVTFKDDIVIKDGGTIGVASDADSITIDSSGNVTASQNLTVTGNLTVSGTTTQVNTVTMNAQNAVVFEGATADAHETTLTIVDPTADHTYKLPDLGSTADEGFIAAFAADPGTSGLITATPAEINLIDGGTSRGTTAVANGDGFLHNDGGTMRMTNVSKIADLFAGDGLSASSSVLSVDAAQTVITSILATDLKIGEDDQTKIDFEDANKINFYANNAKEVELAENSLSPGTSDGTALGTTSLMWSDLFLASGGVINFNNGDVTLTHSSNTLTVAGGTLATAALTTSTIVASGIIKTDDTTDATSTTDGSLQTDGGLSVAKDAIIGDDLYLLSDSAVLGLGAGKDATFTHDGTTGLTIAANPITLDSGADIVFDAAGNDFSFKASGTEVLRITNSSSDVIIKPIVDAKDLIFQQRDGTEVARVEDNATFNFVKDKIAIGGTAMTCTAAELNVLDGVTAGTVAASLGVVVDSNKDIGTFRNITLSGELDAGSLDVSGDADIDGTLEADAITVNGTTLAEFIADTAGAMFSSNTETNVTVTYQDGDNTIDVVVADAADDTKGVVELATTDEALAGSDTSRAVTAAGLAARSYRNAYGNGSATSYTVNHALNTRDVIVQCYDASDYKTVYACVVRTDANNVTVTTATAAASGDLIVLVTKVD